MGHSKSKSLKNKSLLWTVLILALLCSSVGGVWAYLLHSDEKVTNTFVVDDNPNISIGADYTVTVHDTYYPVYLRAAVVVNWKDEFGNVLAIVPTGHTLKPGTGWFLHTDGFYYYNQAVYNGSSTSAVITLTPPTEGQPGYQAGYTLVADVAVQAIQAVGTTDGESPVDAVQNAWGITVAKITTP